ncbi:protoporphyrinogen/coproporphyrinogen oxidase [Archaeoglobus neptunius]|uniref:protoporphyrinogen/coproporphyrinogen oxidase n=1 Tax=Archaeoglobus neptunius TaxID=2798580 RepID=UPI0019279661|nr:FAD-dependent oxidoreductase [Archaeoglobus neptunius]
MVRFGIVGGGLSGLAVGNFLRNSMVFEAEKNAGGLLRSENIGGYTFDTGGSHIIFSKSSDVLSELLTLIGDYVEHRRRTFIYYNNKFIKYPFENGISMLPKQDRFEILKDFVENLLKEKKQPENLLEWFYFVFGREITDRYLRPYNEKIWKRNLEEISLEWVGGRVPNPPIEDILKSAVGIETEGYIHQLRFFYPLYGGIETIARKLSERVELRTEEAVGRISSSDGKLYVATDRGDYEFDKVVYTAPLTDLPRIMDCKEIREDLKSLDYNSLTVVGIGVRGRVPNYHWLYFPQSEILFHRVAFLSNYSPSMAPAGCSTIIAEISRKPGEKLKRVCDRVIDDLREVGFEFNVEVCGQWDWEHAYVVYNHDYRKAVSRIRSFLLRRGVIPFGRFGGWEYLNMDAVFGKARDLALKVEKGMI